MSRRLLKMFTNVKDFLSVIKNDDRHLLLLLVFLSLALLLIQTIQLMLFCKILSLIQAADLSTIFVDNGIKEPLNAFLKNYDLKIEDSKKLEEPLSKSNSIERVKKLIDYIPPIMYDIRVVGTISTACTIAVAAYFAPETVANSFSGICSVFRYLTDPVYSVFGPSLSFFCYVSSFSAKMSVAGVKTIYFFCRDTIVSPSRGSSSTTASIVDYSMSDRSFFAEDYLPQTSEAQAPTTFVGTPIGAPMEIFRELP